MRSSSSRSVPRGRVPAIGLTSTVGTSRPARSTRTEVSGEAPNRMKSRSRDEEHVRAAVERAQPREGGERVGAGRAERARRDDLVHVAGEDMLLQLRHHVRERLVVEIGRDRPCAASIALASAKGRDGAGACRQGGEPLDRARNSRARDCFVVVRERGADQARGQAGLGDHGDSASQKTKSGKAERVLGLLRKFLEQVDMVEGDRCRRRQRVNGSSGGFASKAS